MRREEERRRAEHEQEYIRRQLEEEQRQLEILQQQLLQEQALLLEYKRKQLEEQRQAERLQRQLQQERDYLVSLQQQQQQQQRQPAEKKPLYHYKEGMNATEKPAWAKEVMGPERQLTRDLYRSSHAKVVQPRSLNNPPVIPAKQNHVPKPPMPLHDGKGRAPQSKSKADSNRLPIITISVPQEERKSRPGFPQRRRKDDNMMHLRGTRSQGCSPERQSKLDAKCFSSPHIPAGKPPLPPTQVKMNFKEYSGQKGRTYLPSHMSPYVISPSRSAPSLAAQDNHNLHVSISARNVKVRGYQKKHHASLESLPNHNSLLNGMHQAPGQKKMMGRSMNDLLSSSVGLSPFRSQLNVSAVESLTSGIRSSSLNALSVSSSSDLIPSSYAFHSKSSGGSTSQVAGGSFSSSSYCFSQPFPRASNAKSALGLQANNYPSLSSSTPDLRNVWKSHFNLLPVG
uniref:Uncharacterized protein n=1 Tax=Sphaerodactylus townsendi TaxID=933632 RepID=A0ACB8FCJ6_9SAUR